MIHCTYDGEHEDILHLVIALMLRSIVFHMSPHVQCPASECDLRDKLCDEDYNEAGLSPRGGRVIPEHSPIAFALRPRQA
jgi:hypothetical protein